MSPRRSALLRGTLLGLWILAGLAFLFAALFPGSTGTHTLGLVLLTGAVLTTALPHIRGDQPRGPLSSRMPLGILLGGIAALGIALTVIREGDRRSLLFAGVITIVSLALPTGRRAPGPRGTGYR